MLRILRHRGTVGLVGSTCAVHWPFALGLESSPEHSQGSNADQL